MFPAGKLPLELLESLIGQFHGVDDPSVVVGARGGVDAAVIDIGEEYYLIAKTDPITFVTSRIGLYAITINANDIACMGGRPRWFLATLLLPEGKTDEGLIKNIFSDLSEECKKLNITICGGHTEVTYGIDRPIVIGQMLGLVRKEHLLNPEHIKAGDKLILTKGVGIEATAIMAQEKEEEIRDRFGDEFQKRCNNFIKDPGISVLEEAKIICETGGVKALHDPTEGGLATALCEMARPARLGCRVYEENIIIPEETKKLCEYFGLNPLGVISSGALLAAVRKELSRTIVKKLRASGINATEIGEFTDEPGRYVIVSQGKDRPLSRFDRDEITRIF